MGHSGRSDNEGEIISYKHNYAEFFLNYIMIVILISMMLFSFSTQMWSKKKKPFGDQSCGCLTSSLIAAQPLKWIYGVPGKLQLC